MTTNSRDSRALEILTAPLRIQAWFQMPDREWPEVALFAGDMVQTTITLSTERSPRTALLVEFNSVLKAWDKWHAEDQARLRKMAARLRFAWAGLPRLIAARLIEANRGPADKIRMRLCNPATFGAHFASTIKRATPEAASVFSNRLLVHPYGVEVDRALHWYLAAFDSADPFIETICLWSAIEALSPASKDVAECKVCQHDLLCLSCRAPRAEHHVLASIRTGLSQVSTMTKHQIDSLYEFRSGLIHGQHEPTYATYYDAAQHVETVRPLAQAMLWRELQTEPMQYVQQPCHIHVDLDMVFSCTWHEEVYEV